MASTNSRFRSRAGTSFSAPSDWTSEEDDAAFTLFAPANAAINLFAYNKARWIEDYSLLPDLPPLDEFEIVMTSGVLTKRKDTDWKTVEWPDVAIGGHAARKTELIAEDEANIRWRLYVFETKETFYAILLEATTPAMAAAGAQYEEVIRSLEGVA